MKCVLWVLQFYMSLYIGYCFAILMIILAGNLTNRHIDLYYMAVVIELIAICLTGFAIPCIVYLRRKSFDIRRAVVTGFMQGLFLLPITYFIFKSIVFFGLGWLFITLSVQVIVIALCANALSFVLSFSITRTYLKIEKSFQ